MNHEIYNKFKSPDIITLRYSIFSPLCCFSHVHC